ncbi:MAG: hypothetical protein ACP5JE_03825 [Thermoplasmata archaeon]
MQDIASLLLKSENHRNRVILFLIIKIIVEALYQAKIKEVQKDMDTLKTLMFPKEDSTKLDKKKEEEILETLKWLAKTKFVVTKH